MRQCGNGVIYFVLSILFLVNLFSYQPVYAQDVEVLLEMSLDELLDIVIETAGKQEEKVSEIPASVVIISREDIKKYGYAKLSDILENIPGLYMVDDYFFSGMINFGVRGYFAEGAFTNMIIMVNGIKLNERYYENNVLNRLPVPVEAIDRIEVVRGPMSVMYGSGAFFGAINIITNEVNADKPTQLVSASLGSEKIYKMMGRLSGTEGNFRYTLNTSLYKNGGIDVPYSEMISQSSSFAGYGLAQDERTGGKFEEDNKYFNFSGKLNNFSLEMNYAEATRGIASFSPPIMDGSPSKLGSATIALGYEKEVSEKFTIDAKIDYSDYMYNLEYHLVNPEFYGKSIVKSTSYRSELTTFFIPKPNLDITTGVYFQSILEAYNAYDFPAWSLDNYKLGLPDDEDYMSLALFSQANYSPFDKLKLVGGIRFEKIFDYDIMRLEDRGYDTYKGFFDTYKQKKIDIVPRFAAIFSLNERNIFKFMYGKAIKEPSISQNCDLVDKPDKPKLMAADIQTFEINYISAFSSRMMANISVFRNQLDHLISRIQTATPEGGFVYWSANSGKILTHGIEVACNVSPIKNFNMEVAAVYQESDNKTEGWESIDLEFSPNVLGYFKASYRYQNKAIISINSRFVDDMLLQWRQTGLIPEEGERYPPRHVNSYFVVDLNFRLENIMKQGLYAGLKVTNLLDKKFYYAPSGYSKWADKGFIGHGRVIILSAGYEF